MPQAAIPYITLALSAVSTGVAIEGAQSAKTAAKKKNKLQKEQAAIQDRLAKAEMRRNARITEAKYAASLTASGATGSVAEGYTTGIATSTQAQTDIYTEQGAIQNQQFDIAKDQTIDAANLSIAQSVASFGSDVYDFSETEAGQNIFG